MARDSRKNLHVFRERRVYARREMSMGERPGSFRPKMRRQEEEKEREMEDEAMR